MQTRRWLTVLLVLCAAAWSADAAQILRIAVDEGVTVVEYDGRDWIVETSAPIVVEFRTSADGVSADVMLLPGASSATVRITAADDPREVIFDGVVRDADDFRDLFYHHETGRGEQ